MAMTPSRSEFPMIAGRRYHVRVWGDEAAPPLFCLHGWGDTSASFQFVADALVGRFRILAPDWRGFGLSQWNESAYWFPDYIGDLDALITHYSPERPAQVVGHSMGGIVAGLYAGVRPQRVERLVNLEGFGLWVLPPQEAPGRIAKWLEQLRANDAAFRRYASRADFAAQMIRMNPRLLPERAAFLSEHALIESDGAFVFAADPRHRWLSPVLFPLAEAQACWRATLAPTLWVAGGDSAVMRGLFADPERYRESKACLARVEEARIDDCGHNLHHDRPLEVARLVSSFFAAPA